VADDAGKATVPVRNGLGCGDRQIGITLTLDVGAKFENNAVNKGIRRAVMLKVNEGGCILYRLEDRV
jgi:hypothetical protein